MSELARFEAPTMNEALAKIRSAFGEDAMIVGTRTFRRGGLLGLGGKQRVEVFVADTRSRIENLKRVTTLRSAAASAVSAVSESGEFTAPAVAREALPGAPAAKRPESYDRISTSLDQIRDEIQSLISRSSSYGAFTHPFLKECYELLIEREVEPRIADAVTREIANLRLPPGYPDRSSVLTVARSELGKLFKETPPVGPSEGPRLVVLVGPTGVGKTTTIAKLAARAKLHQMRSVALITLDTFRIGAAEQLGQYAKMIEVPIDVVGDPAELEAAVSRTREAGTDLVYIDSAGRSQRDELKMSELTEFLAVVPGAEVHLVLSATTQPRTIKSIAERFEPLGFDRIILTKVDETFAFGTLVGALVDTGKAVSWITDGQNVPDDIVPSDPDRLVDLVLKAESP